MFPVQEGTSTRDGHAGDLAKADASDQFRGLQCFPNQTVTWGVPTQQGRCKKSFAIGTIHDPLGDRIYYVAGNP